VDATTLALETPIEKPMIAEVVLQESEAQVQALFTAIPAPLVIFRVVDGVILYTNEHYHSTFDLTTNVLELWCNAAHRQALLDVLSPEGFLSHYELRINQQDGQPLWVVASLQLLIFGKEPAILAILQEVKQSKQAFIPNPPPDLNLDEVLAVSPDHFYLYNREGRFTYVNRAGAAAFGLESKDILGKTWQELNFPPETMKCIETQREVVFSTGQTLIQETSFPTIHGIRDFEYILTPIHGNDGSVDAVVSTVRDITDRKRAEEEIRLLHTIIEAIASAKDFHSALGVALRLVGETTGWNFGEAWIPRKDNTVLECSPAWYSSSEYLTSFRQVSQGFTFAPGVGLPGRVWSSQKAEWLPDVSMMPDQVFRRVQVAQECGLKAGFGVPILANHQVLAVLTFFICEPRQEDKRLVDLVGCVAAQLGEVIQRKLAEAALQESQRRLATLIDALPGIVFACNNDPEWSMNYLSEGCLTLTGYKSEELIARQTVTYNTITHPLDLPNVLTAINDAIASQQPYVIEYRIRTKSGVEKWVWEKGSGVYDSTGKVLGIEGFITDITDRKRSEEALRQTEAKYRSIFENAIEGIFQTTVDGRYISANPALARLYGYASPAELMSDLVDIEHQLYVEPKRRTEFIRLLQANDAVEDFESQIFRRDGSTIWIAENARAVRDTDGTLLYYEGTVEDITERKRTKEQLLQHAFFDTLTRLPNRALFMDRLRQTIERAKRRPEYRFAVLFLDLDGFKQVNDSLGHLVGDQLLIAIARRLETCVRSQDTVARLGGDEFTILLEDIEAIQNAIEIAERIQLELKIPLNLNGKEVFAAASAGIAIGSGSSSPCSTFYHRAEEVLRDADIALYRAKTLGKGRYEMFNKM
jgi:diguanylate cyclase (GGDEF)-like protein/PAS domain S-box-containing protein